MQKVLLTPSQEFVAFWNATHLLKGPLKSCFKKIVNYIEVLLFHLHSRFLPWPEWMVSCNSCFNSILEVPDEVRKTSFEQLLEQKCGPVPLTEEEKVRLRADYSTLLVIVSSFFRDHKFRSPEEMWYSLLTKEEYYKQLMTLNEYALRFLTRTSNECIVESQVSSIENIETSSRHLKHVMGEWPSSALFPGSY